MATPKADDSVRTLVADGLVLLERSASPRINRRKAEALFERALALAPDDLEALFYLAWSFDRGNSDLPDAKARVEPMCKQILRLTTDVPIKSAKQPSIAAKARSFALVRDAAPRISATARVPHAERLFAEANEAYTLRQTPVTEHARLGAEATLELARARAGKRLEPAYRWLLDWVANHPVHSAYAFNPDYDFNRGLVSARGLEAFFEDPGFVAWVRAEQPRARLTPKLANRAVANAAGYDALLNGPTTPEQAGLGRLGRLLALRALGASLESRIESPHGTGMEWGTVEIAALAAPWLLPALVELGVDLDLGIEGTPPVMALLAYGALDAVRALVEAGASLEATDKTGQNVVELAHAKHHQRAVKFFKTVQRR